MARMRREPASSIVRGLCERTRDDQVRWKRRNWREVVREEFERRRRRGRAGRERRVESMVWGGGEGVAIGGGGCLFLRTRPVHYASWVVAGGRAVGFCGLEKTGCIELGNGVVMMWGEGAVVSRLRVPGLWGPAAGDGMRRGFLVWNARLPSLGSG